MRELTFRPYTESVPNEDAIICVKLGQALLSEKLQAGDRTSRHHYAELLEAYISLLEITRTSTEIPDQWAETIRMRYDGGSIRITEAAYLLLVKAWDLGSVDLPAREAPILVKVDAYLEDIPVIKSE
mgnify:CR=1 FL=1